MNAKKSVSMKVVGLLLAAVLLIGCVVGGTVAYLMTNTNTVTNTFVVGDIGTLKLTENDTVITETQNSFDFEIVPGVDIAKKVEVEYSYTDKVGYDAVPVYVFVKVGAANWTVDPDSDNMKYTVSEGDKTLLSWSIDSGWTHLQKETDGSQVYYREVAENVKSDNALVIAANSGEGDTGNIDVSSEITKANIEKVKDAAGNITITAYAIQKDTFADAAAAWTAVKAQ